MTNATLSVSAPTFGDNMKGLDTFSTGYAAAEAKYMTELSATQQKLEAAEARIKASQEQGSKALPEELLNEIRQMRKGLINARGALWIGTNQQAIIDRDYPVIASLSAPQPETDRG